MSAKRHSDAFFHSFRGSIEGLGWPELFNFPFYYEPHPVALQAARELQEYLEKEAQLPHNFGLDSEQKGLVIGKMFGVLVVRDANGQTGYLAAFSGKLGNSNTYPHFVPPLFDMLDEEGFFRVGERELTAVNQRIDVLESNPKIAELQEKLIRRKAELEAEIEQVKIDIKQKKKARKQRRQEQASILSEKEFETFCAELGQESIAEQLFLKNYLAFNRYRLAKVENPLNRLLREIEGLKEYRKNKSNDLQQQLFAEYNFLNALGEKKNVIPIFENTELLIPPAGSGECAAPKLLQYAFEKGYEPIALAEFWWGASPNSEIRKHKQFYPACRSKCEPILGHMLQGISVEENPMLTNPAKGKEIEIIYQDDAIAVIHKPAEFLSVPGKNILDSVYTRALELFPAITGPVIVHRLDMSTSGLMVLAKNEKAYQDLQSQFISRRVKKRYVALLEGTLTEKKGKIELPLRVDLDNRPQQLVCFEHGKKAVTHFQVLSTENNQTRVHFYPITGRTHQLRVHAAHSSGLNAPIVGDDLYGKRSDRLYLHAEWIEIQHPTTKQRMTFQKDPEF